MNREGPPRWLDPAIALCAIVASATLLVFPAGLPKQHRRVDMLPLTVIPSDATDLDCAGAVDLGGSHCGYDANEKATGATSPLRPYQTTYGETVLVAGVFEERNVVRWLAESRASNDSSRVTVECWTDLLGTVGSVSIRWHRDQRFTEVHDTLAARVRSCRVSGVSDDGLRARAHEAAR